MQRRKDQTMKDGGKHSLKRAVMAAAAIGVLVVAQPTIAGADHPGHIDADTDEVTFNADVPIGPISVPANFRLCSGTRCVQDEDVPAQNGGRLLLAITGQPSTVANLSAVPAECPMVGEERLLGAVINFAATGDTGFASVSGSFTPTGGGTPIAVGPIHVEPNPQGMTGSLRLCALNPVQVSS